MSIEPVEFLAAAQPIRQLAGVEASAPQASGLQAMSVFSQWFTGQVEKVSGQLEVADRQLQAVATGAAQNLHQVMISLEEARLSFQLLTQVRNRVLEAYQDVMRMQV